MPGRLGIPGVLPSLGLWGAGDSPKTENVGKPSTPRNTARRHGGSRVMAKVDDNQAVSKPGVTSNLKLT
jgi:hypothetical protein